LHNPCKVAWLLARKQQLLELAETKLADLGCGGALRFKTGDVSKTGFDGAFSMDVLLFVADKRAALHEIARILKPGSGFVGTSWELRAESAALHAPAFDDYPGAFKDAGFEIEIYEETGNWRRLLTDAISAVVASDDAIEGPAAERLLEMGSSAPWRTGP
jgi:ubiquinone/menaquinone biosynthesis C-methylase UbiE